MLHPGAQASAEHRRTPTGSPECPMSPSVSASRQSGLQSSAQSQHHLGASFSLAQPHCSDIVHVRPNNLKLVSTFRGEDHTTATVAANTPAVTTDRCSPTTK
jgi:hypothetical protein